jgi:hypothetical protein
MDETDGGDPPYYVVAIRDGAKEAGVSFQEITKIPKLQILTKDEGSGGVLFLKRMQTETSGKGEKPKLFDFSIKIEAKFALNQSFSFEDLMSGNIGFGD